MSFLGNARAGANLPPCSCPARARDDSSTASRVVNGDCEWWIGGGERGRAHPRWLTQKGVRGRHLAINGPRLAQGPSGVALVCAGPVWFVGLGEDLRSVQCTDTKMALRLAAAPICDWRVAFIEN